MLNFRFRRWPNIKSTLSERIEAGELSLNAKWNGREPHM